GVRASGRDARHVTQTAHHLRTVIVSKNGLSRLPEEIAAPTHDRPRRCHEARVVAAARDDWLDCRASRGVRDVVRSYPRQSGREDDQSGDETAHASEGAEDHCPPSLHTVSKATACSQLDRIIDRYDRTPDTHIPDLTSSVASKTRATRVSMRSRVA